MLSGLFKPAWQSPSPEKRVQAIDKMDIQDEEGRLAVESLAQDDPELSVRQAAIDKLPADALFPIADAHSDDTTRSYAESAFSSLIGSGSELTLEGFRSLLGLHPDASDWIARLCPIASLRHELLQPKTEPELAALISDIDYAETRKLIAERLESPEQLEVARKLLKGKDKSAEKIIKSKLDSWRAAQRLEAENRELAGSLCEKMEYLSSNDWRAEFKGRYLACISQWDGLNFEPDTELQSRFEKAKTVTKSEHEKQERLEECQRQQQVMAADLEQRFASLAPLSLEDLAAQWPQAQTHYKSSKETWDALSAEIFPRLNIADQYAAAETALVSVTRFMERLKDVDLSADLTALDTHESASQATAISTALSCIKLPANYPALTVNTELKEKLSAYEAQVKAAQKDEKDRLDKLHKRINRLLGSTNRGELGRANRELEAVTKAAEKYSGKDRASLDERIAKAAESVKKMGDWKDFATEPKYIELCEAMEALATSKTHPEALAQEIKALQTSWKSLGYSESSDQHWERFKVAGDAAYEPCAAFFKARLDTRKSNLAEREKLVDQAREILEGTAWDAQPDYKNIDSQMRRLMNDWKKITDVDQKPGQKQWKRFSGLRSDINAKLGLVYDANIALKHQLIQQAETLAEAELKEDSLPRLQQLQTGWKQVGVTRRKEDQEAWSKFKTATDAVYEKIQGVRQTRRDDENQQLDGYRSIIKQIQALAKTAKNLADSDHSFERLQTEYEALPPLPKALPEKLLEGLAKDFRRASDDYSRARDRILDAAGKEQVNALAEKARLCIALEKLADGGSAEEIESMKSDIDDIELHDKSLQKRFDTRLASALDADKSAATERRRLLCIDIEILLGIESPPEDKAERMQIQLERMSKRGIGGGTVDKKSALEDYRLDWLCLPGAEPASQTMLDERFAKLVK